MNRKVLIVFILLSLTLLGCDVVNINIPNEIDFIIVDLSDKQSITITEDEEINNIIMNIKSNTKYRSKNSVDDVPNVEYYIKFDFESLTDENTIIYIYEIEGKYYVEQPYIGIWTITKEDYNNLYGLILK